MKLRLGHLDWEVRRPTPTEQIDDNLGVCFADLGVIVVKAAGPPCQQAAVLMHEVLHAIYATFNVQPKQSEEATVRALEGPLVAFLSDNPRVVASIIAARGGVPLPIN